jgi:hypothetical protein
MFNKIFNIGKEIITAPIKIAADAAESVGEALDDVVEAIVDED